MANGVIYLLFFFFCKIIQARFLPPSPSYLINSKFQIRVFFFLPPPPLFSFLQIIPMSPFHRNILFDSRVILEASPLIFKLVFVGNSIVVKFVSLDGRNTSRNYLFNRNPPTLFLFSPLHSIQSSK